MSNGICILNRGETEAGQFSTEWRRVKILNARSLSLAAAVKLGGGGGGGAAGGGDDALSGGGGGEVDDEPPKL